MYSFFPKKLVPFVYHFCFLQVFLCGFYSGIQKLFILPRCKLQGYSNDSFRQFKLASSAYKISHPQLLQFPLHPAA